MKKGEKRVSSLKKFNRLASTQKDLYKNFALAAEHYLRADKLSDSEARKAFYGLISLPNLSWIEAHWENRLKSVPDKTRKTIFAPIRSHDHPLRPKNYFDTDSVWGKFGFIKIPLVFSFPWPTCQLDTSAKVEKNSVACWINDFKI